VPNIKMGIAMNQAMINALERIRAMGGVDRDDVGFFVNRYNQNDRGCEVRRRAAQGSLQAGHVARRLQLRPPRHQDERRHVGMYSDLKVTTGTAWSSVSGTG
jgi:hypothetical protein